MNIVHSIARLVNMPVIGHPAGAMNLSHDRIVEAALAVLQEEGLAAVNMRAIAARLHVRASALYRYFPGKEQLLGALSAHIFLEARGVLAEDLDWSEWLLSFGRSLRGSLLRYRDSAVLCTSAPPPSGDAQDSGQSIAAPLTSRGVPEDEALSEIASVIAFTVGLTAYQQSEAHGEFLERMFGFDRAFERGLQALVRGFGGSVDEPASPSL